MINRGNFRKNLFSTYKTADAFSKTLFEACDRFSWWLHAYVIMDNHFHLCLETPDASLIDGMHWLQSSFANRFSAFSGERGHVFQGRYKSLIIEGDTGLLNVVDYIHLNPVRSGMMSVGQLRRYSRSSFPKFFSERRHPRLRCADFLDHAGGLKPGQEGMQKYHTRLKAIMALSLKDRDRLYGNLTSGWYIGPPEGKLRLSQRVEDGEVEATTDARAELVTQTLDTLMQRGMTALGKSEKDIRKDLKSSPWKLALASWIKERNPAKNRELSELLNMGHPATMSNHLSAYRESRRNRCPHSRKLTTLLKN